MKHSDAGGIGHFSVVEPANANDAVASPMIAMIFVFMLFFFSVLVDSILSTSPS